MAWIPLIATFLGLSLGLGSALISDRVKSGRERRDRWMSLRREVYVAYLAALHQANEGMRAVSLGEHPAELSRESAARAAFRAAGVTPAREHVALIAPEPVVMAADAAFLALRDLRTRIAQGEDLKSPGYEPVLLTYGEKLQALRNAVREDLGVAALAVQIAL
jgi:hypothetical protein